MSTGAKHIWLKCATTVRCSFEGLDRFLSLCVLLPSSKFPWRCILLTALDLSHSLCAVFSQIIMRVNSSRRAPTHPQSGLNSNFARRAAHTASCWNGIKCCRYGDYELHSLLTQESALGARRGRMSLLFKIIPLGVESDSLSRALIFTHSQAEVPLRIPSGQRVIYLSHKRRKTFMNKSLSAYFN